MKWVAAGQIEIIFCITNKALIKFSSQNIIKQETHPSGLLKTKKNKLFNPENEKGWKELYRRLHAYTNSPVILYGQVVSPQFQSSNLGHQNS